MVLALAALTILGFGSIVVGDTFLSLLLALEAAFDIGGIGPAGVPVRLPPILGNAVCVDNVPGVPAFVISRCYEMHGGSPSALIMHCPRSPSCEKPGA